MSKKEIVVWEKNTETNEVKKVTLKVVGELIMFAGLVSMVNFLPHYKDYKDE